MADIRDYLHMSTEAKSVLDLYTSSNDFASTYKKVNFFERNSYLRHYLVNNKPYAFNSCPILFEQIIEYFSNNIEISASDIKLIGSAKTGFSISENHYGRSYISENSDLDFSIINEALFNRIKGEFELWNEEFKNERIVPFTNGEQRFWPLNVDTGNNQLRRGFLDSKYIPNRDQFPFNQRINKSLYYIKKYLADIHYFKIKEGSASVYKDCESFFSRLKRNTEICIR